MLSPRNFQTPNAIDGGDPRPALPDRNSNGRSNENQDFLYEDGDPDVRLRAQILLTKADHLTDPVQDEEEGMEDVDHNDLVIHDQLPSVDDAHINAGRLKPKRSSAVFKDLIPSRGLWRATREPPSRQDASSWPQWKSTAQLQTGCIDPKNMNIRDIGSSSISSPTGSDIALSVDTAGTSPTYSYGDPPKTPTSRTSTSTDRVDETIQKAKGKRNCRVLSIFCMILFNFGVGLLFGVVFTTYHTATGAAQGLSNIVAEVTVSPSASIATPTTAPLQPLTAAPVPPTNNPTIFNKIIPTPTIEKPIATLGPLFTPPPTTPLVHSGMVPLPSERFQKIVQFLTLNQISYYPNLQDSQSSQYKAARWMADTDFLKYDIPANPDDFSTRFLQRYALVVLAHEMNFPFWFATPGMDECAWFKLVEPSENPLDKFVLGVTCDELQRVENIVLPESELRGTFPPELEQLTSVKFIDLHKNDISGTIPKQLESMSHLEFLDLRSNQLEGTLPELTWPKLIVLSLSDNKNIEGTIPGSFSFLSELRTIALSRNSLKGNIDALSFLHNLEYVFLEHNSFTGIVDNEFMAKMSNLRHLDLGHNRFESSGLPVHLLKHPSLQRLDLDNNRLGGFLPIDISVNTILQHLNLGHNLFQGTIPEILGFELQSLKYLDVSGNWLEGFVPSSLAYLPALTSLHVGDNSYEVATIPSWITTMTGLQELTMDRSHLIGTISPELFSNLRHLKYIDLSTNELDGSIPGTIGESQVLEYLLLQKNQLTGRLPPSMALLSDLSVLLIQDNNLEGQVCAVTMSDNNIAADCEEVDCPCCKKCCTDGNSCSVDELVEGIEDKHSEKFYVKPGTPWDFRVPGRN